MLGRPRNEHSGPPVSAGDGEVGCTRLARSLPEKVATAVYEFVTGPLLENPKRVGKPLNPPLAPAYSARRGEYRVLYLIDDANRTVEVTAISHRADAYR